MQLCHHAVVRRCFDRFFLALPNPGTLAFVVASRLMSTWYTAVLRGVAALGLALLCLAHTSATPAYRADVFAAYALADGILCGFGAIALKRRWGRRRSALPLLAGAAGIGIGIYLLAAPSVSPVALALAMAVWGLAVGLATLDCGYALYRGAPGPCRVVALTSGVRLRRGAATECGMLLAGAVALAFALVALTLAAAGTAIPLSLVALFAAAFGYLHVRVGLTHGALAVATGDAVAERRDAR
jgi:uncharacterized membrane protein HdeD (DUF308 family)